MTYLHVKHSKCGLRRVNLEETGGQRKKGGEKGREVAPNATLLTQHKNKEEPCENAPSILKPFFAGIGRGEDLGGTPPRSESDKLESDAEGRHPPPGKMSE